ncbi:MAG: HupE/UreJ family protein, partial [Gemmatimonadales bacterium]
RTQCYGGSPWARCVPGRLLLPLVLWLGSVGLVLAHDPGLSAADLRLQPDRLIADLSFARADIERLVPIDTDGNQLVAPDELAAARPRLEGLAREALEISFDGRGVAPTGVAVSLDTSSAVHFHLSFPGTVGRRLGLRSALLPGLPRGHRQYLSLRNAEGGLVAERMLDASTGRLEITTGGSTAPGAAPPSFRQFLSLGVHHILTGYDHLLFLFALLLPGFSFLTALKIITSFTIAHSLTLSLATLDLVRVPAAWVEPLIALSIVYVGVENILRRDPARRWLLTFGFGLVHGFGFASVLRDLGIGADGGPAAVPLLSFNMGVEAGQVALVALVLPLMWRLRQHSQLAHRAVPACSVLVSLAGGYWLIQRTLLS